MTINNISDFKRVLYHLRYLIFEDKYSTECICNRMHRVFQRRDTICTLQEAFNLHLAIFVGCYIDLRHVI